MRTSNRYLYTVKSSHSFKKIQTNVTEEVKFKTMMNKEWGGRGDDFNRKIESRVLFFFFFK